MTEPRISTPAPEPLTGEVRIWRYMDTMKLLSILADRTLYFARADNLGDPHEGAPSRPDLERLLERMRTLDAVDQRRAEVEAFTQARVERLRRYGISCWHMADSESMAMWHQYGLRGAGVAIESTVGHVFAALKAQPGPPRDIHAVRVVYADYETLVFGDPDMDPVCVKRLEFASESEVRFITELTVHEIIFGELSYQSERGVAIGRDTCDLIDPGVRGPGRGVMLNCDPQQLIKAVVLGPGATGMEVHVIESTLAKYDIQVPVRRTSLAKPRYDRISY